MTRNSVAPFAGATRSQCITAAQIEGADGAITRNRRRNGDDKVADAARSGTVIHPGPVGVYTVPPLDITVPSLDTTVPSCLLWELLHLHRAKAIPQGSEGDYRGKKATLTLSDVERHLAGEIALAFSAVAGTKGLFAVLDLDARFPNLLPAIREHVSKIGGDALYQACFITNGSDEGRGKVVVCFAEPVAIRDARWLAQQLRRRIRASEAGQCLETKAFSAFPQEKSGGVVRILGRNRGRSGPRERAFSLDGELGLLHVRPLTAATLASMARASVDPGPRAWLARFLNTPWIRSDGTDKHFAHMLAIAREAIRVYGTRSGRQMYYEWLEQIKSNSPQLAVASEKRKDPRNVLDHGRDRAWRYAVADPTSWRPLDLSTRKGMPRGVLRLYNALTSYVRAHGLIPTAFGIDYERIGILLMSTKSTAYRLVRRANELGVLAIHDRGLPDEKGFRGKCTLLGLVGFGETRDQVRAAGARDESVRRRLVERERRNRLL